MNKKLPLILGLAAFSAVAQNPDVPPAADPVPPPAPVSPNPASPAPATQPAQVTPPSRPASPRNKRAAKAPAAVAGVMAEPVTPVPEGAAGAKGGLLAGGAAIAAAEHATAMNILALLPRSTKTTRTLVIQSSEPDPAAVGNAEEDLSVMAVILRKATAGARSGDKRIALGIEVDSTVFGSSSGARNIYLEGYGALFLLGVRFPLVAPPEKAEEVKVKDQVSKDWEEAREEYINESRGTFWTDEDFDRVRWKGLDRQPAEEYDADKVEELKTALLESLRNATHIRALKPTDYVTVVIQGGEIMRGEKPAGRGGAGGRSPASSRADSRRAETVMTMRVKKSDVDAFAKGSLDFEGFRKKTSIQSYFRRGDSSVATSLFPATTPAR